MKNYYRGCHKTTQKEAVQRVLDQRDIVWKLSDRMEAAKDKRRPHRLLKKNYNKALVKYKVYRAQAYEIYDKRYNYELTK